MIDDSMSGSAYNRYDNLDTVEDRIIYYLLSPANKTPAELEQVHILWRLLCYNGADALYRPLPSYADVVKLIYNDDSMQTPYRIFRSPRLEDGWNEQCSLIKVYIDSISPVNHIKSIVNIGIDVVVNSKIINLKVPEDDVNVLIDTVDDIPVRVQTKSRVSVLVKAILSLLNGADVAGVGKLIFSRQNSIYDEAQYGLWNNRSFEGMKMIISTSMSGVS